MRQYYVYILSSFSGTLYVGVTNDIEGEDATTQIKIDKRIHKEI